MLLDRIALLRFTAGSSVLAMAGEEAMEPFMGMKARRRSSMHRVFSADYIDVPANPTLVKLLSKQGDKQVLFADNVMMVNGKCKLVRRVLIVTDVAVYLLDSTFYRLKHRIPLQNIEKVSLSELSDNFFAINIPSEYDCLMASTRKSEIVTVLVEAVKQLISSNSPENELQVKLSNCFEYYIDAEHIREVHFEPVEGGRIKTTFVDK